MGARRTIEVSLRLDVDAEPIAGHLRHGQTPPRPFYGWLELASAVEHALSTGRQALDRDKATGATKDT